MRFSWQVLQVVEDSSLSISEAMCLWVQLEGLHQQNPFLKWSQRWTVAMHALKVPTKPSDQSKKYRSIISKKKKKKKLS